MIHPSLQAVSDAHSGSQPARAFLITQMLPAPSAAELHTVERAFELACGRLNSAGTPIRLLTMSYVPSQQRWLGLVLADSHEAARLVLGTAQLVAFDVTEV